MSILGDSLEFACSYSVMPPELSNPLVKTHREN